MGCRARRPEPSRGGPSCPPFGHTQAYGRRRPEDGRIDWRVGARQVHDLVRAVAPPFPGAFTEVNGCRLGLLETRLDTQPPKFAPLSPCLYLSEGGWYTDCVDGRRLKILQLTVNGEPVAHNTVPPALAQQPLALKAFEK